MISANSYLANIINHMKEDALSAELSIDNISRVNLKLADASLPYLDKVY